MEFPNLIQNSFIHNTLGIYNKVKIEVH